jgi:putative colanic acid biosynthesis acetyltransferase WcaF
MNKVNLNSFNNSEYNPGSIFKRFIWYFKNLFLFKSSIPWPYSWKRIALRFFGAKVGENVIIKPCVNIKYPWFLEIGENSWIGEEVWLDNLDKIVIGNNVCISQGALLLTGNHNYKQSTFDLMLKPIIIKDGVWIGAKAVVCPGVTMHSHSVLTAGSVLTKDSEDYLIYQGNPAVAVRKRELIELT